MTTDEILSRARELLSKATHGEWIGFAGVIQYIAPEDCTVERKMQRDVKKKHLVGVNSPDCKDGQPEAKNNGEFIAFARNEMPAILNLCERLRAALKVSVKENRATLSTLRDLLNGDGDYFKTSKVGQEMERLRTDLEYWKLRAAENFTELAALKKEIEEAPVVFHLMDSISWHQAIVRNLVGDLKIDKTARLIRIEELKK